MNWGNSKKVGEVSPKPKFAHQISNGVCVPKRFMRLSQQSASRWSSSVLSRNVRVHLPALGFGIFADSRRLLAEILGPFKFIRVIEICGASCSVQLTAELFNPFISSLNLKVIDGRG
jgi:hypothetical protein